MYEAAPGGMWNDAQPAEKAMTWLSHAKEDKQDRLIAEWRENPPTHGRREPFEVDKTKRDRGFLSAG